MAGVYLDFYAHYENYWNNDKSKNIDNDDDGDHDDDDENDDFQESDCSRLAAEQVRGEVGLLIEERVNRSTGG